MDGQGARASSCRIGRPRPGESAPASTAAVDAGADFRREGKREEREKEEGGELVRLTGGVRTPMGTSRDNGTN